MPWCIRSRHTAALLALFLALLAPPADACSCVYTEGEFLAPQSATLPADAAGVLWWGDPVMAPETAFQIVRTDGGRAQVPVRIDLADTEFTMSETVGRRGALFLVRPEDGFEAGASYRISYRSPRDAEGDGDAPHDPASSIGIDVGVSREALDWPEGRVEVPVRTLSLTREDVTTMTLAGSCSVTVEAATAGLQMDLPPALDPWRDHVRYSVFVNDSLWRPDRSLCSPTRPGELFGGAGEPGRTQVYAVCPDPSRNGWGRPAATLSQGRRQVRMVAWLPGRDGVYEGSTEVELTCP